MVVHMTASTQTTLSAARSIVDDVVWATVTTVGPDDAPRSRLVHPVWRWDGDVPTAYVVSRPTPLKLAHLRAHPAASCFYWSPKHDTAAFDCSAEWLPAERLLDVWQEIAATPPPMGFDPAAIWPGGPTSPDYAVILLRAHRVIARAGVEQLPTWRAPRAD